MRVVLDTNVVISALLFPRGRAATLREAWFDGRFMPLTDRPCVDELIRALAYPKFKLSQGDIQALLADYLPYAEAVDTVGVGGVKVPVCRDPDDQKFLVLAEMGRADVLITGDKALLALAGTAHFVIEGPGKFLQRLAS